MWFGGASQGKWARSQSGMQDGSLVKRRESQQALSETFLPWSRTQLSEAGKDAVVMNRGQVYAQTFVARRWSVEKWR